MVGSDSGRICILEYNAAKNSFDRVHIETFGKSGCRRKVLTLSDLFSRMKNEGTTYLTMGAPNNRLAGRPTGSGVFLGDTGYPTKSTLNIYLILEASITRSNIGTLVSAGIILPHFDH